MTKSRHRRSSSSSPSSLGYLRRRSQELASPTTRAISDPLAEWAVKRIRLDGRPFRFEGHEYLRALYDDTSPHIILSKAAQIGGTTYAILRAIHACLNDLNVIYFVPTRTDVLEFSKSRVGPLLGDNPFLDRSLHDTDTAGLKRIGNAHLYLRGMQSTVGMKSVPADMIVFDELDEATPEAKALAWERIAHSSYKRVIELSNPSLPDYGIDASYQKSDQRHWNLKCPACNAWTCLEREFPTRRNEEVRIIRQGVDGRWFRACHACGRELDLSQGEWVADFPDRPIHGYRISQLHSTFIDAGEILEEYRTTRYLDTFYTMKIGIPWADLERRLDVATVLSQCGARPLMPKERRLHVMGVDTGKDFHVVILARDWYRECPLELVETRTVQSFGELDRLMRQYGTQRCVIDGMPETHATRDFARRHRNVFLCFFSEGQTGNPNWDRQNEKVTVNRTEALDASRTIIRDRRLTLPQATPEIHEFARHLACDAKVLEEDEKTGDRRYRYVRTGANHYSMALTYALLAAESVSMPLTPEQYQRLCAMLS